jgi:hypothetical protein
MRVQGECCFTVSDRMSLVPVERQFHQSLIRTIDYIVYQASARNRYALGKATAHRATT